MVSDFDDLDIYMEDADESGVRTGSATIDNCNVYFNVVDNQFVNWITPIKLVEKLVDVDDFEHFLLEMCS